MPHREVTLTMAEVQRYETIRAAVEGRLTGEEAAKALGLSRRQVERLKAKVRAEGTAGVRHGNAGRGPWNKTPDGLRRRLIDLATGEYAAYNFSHLADTLAEDRDLHRSDETLRQWLRPLGHGRPMRRAKVHRLRRRRKDHEGEWLFLDGSPHPWFGPDYDPVCLLLSTDDATGKPLWGKFQPHEDRDGCFEVCYHVFRTFGLNGLWYLDRASQFKTTRHGGLHVAQRLQQDDTPFQQAMQRLAVGARVRSLPTGPRPRRTHQRLLSGKTRRRTHARRDPRLLDRHTIPQPHLHPPLRQTVAAATTPGGRCPRASTSEPSCASAINAPSPMTTPSPWTASPTNSCRPKDATTSPMPWLKFNNGSISPCIASIHATARSDSSLSPDPCR